MWGLALLVVAHSTRGTEHVMESFSGREGERELATMDFHASLSQWLHEDRFVIKEDIGPWGL